jgi:murein DD-endopeptidase MepM/ murein hydrolase activator NlpD
MRNVPYTRASTRNRRAQAERGMLNKKIVISMKCVLLILSIFFLPQIVHAGKARNPTIILDPKTPGPGDIMVVTVKGADGPVEGKFDKRKIYFNPAKESVKAVVGIDLHLKPGVYTLELAAKGAFLTKRVKVIRKHYPLQRLTLPKDMVELSPENEARAEREQHEIEAFWPKETDRDWSGDFINPREGKLSTIFGMRRVMNNIPKNPHSGVDVEANEGDEVRAPNNGIVVMTDDLFYSGNSIFLDHGQGIYTMFFHLSKILVKPGQAVKKGEVIGLVGSTGRSTGAHLHWGVRMQGARVDPMELIHLDLE